MTTSDEKLPNLNQGNLKLWSKPINKIIGKLILIELVFLTIFETMVINFKHIDHELIYYTNIVIYSLIAILAYFNLSLSKLNKDVAIIIGVWALIMTPYTSFFIFQNNFSPMFNFLNFHVLYIFSISFRLFFTIFLFLYSLNPFKSSKRYLFNSAIICLFVSCLIYLPIFVSGEYRHSYNALFERSYYAQIFNLSMLLIFWHQYTKSKIIVSEYLSNILSVWTVIIALEIFHYFSTQNDLLLHYIVQYFYALLYFIIVVLLFARVNYLLTPSSKENEKYIENYFMLKGFIDKPRRGLFVEFYSGMNKFTLLTISSLLVFLGVYLYFFDKFTVFIKLNILLLIIATIVSALLAIVTWHKRWYDAIGVFFKKNR